jgi:hypothetical protein
MDKRDNILNSAKIEDFAEIEDIYKTLSEDVAGELLSEYRQYRLIKDGSIK